MARGSDRNGNGAGRRAVAAGGVVYRLGSEGIEVVLVARHREGLWALPKGTPEPEETLEETAVREVREETGLETAVLEALGTVRYYFLNRDGERVDKTVHHFLLEPTGGSFERHDHEFDHVGWYDVHEAQRRLTHRNQLHILDRAVELIAGGSSRVFDPF
jgi:8-oxo-dGTP pyrophosphatase MutT (NUDIX family)